MSHLTDSTRASILHKAHKQGKALGIGESLEEPGGEQSGQATATRRHARWFLFMLAYLHHDAIVSNESPLVKAIVIPRGLC